ncbi:MAG: diphosphate--fructose-6-phosphate 1-phosphotransferase [Spirochaetaceae bacterium]|jgi:pyrophosphate--fructose-6-phosphate 1-phosphotransferase|nr:diphosphate--fructose-6-phosphate 1-phosphotransferase [Spirochaetaceae bacterium]
MEISTLQKIRYNYYAKLPDEISGNVSGISIKLGEPTEALADRAELKEIFKLTYGKPIAGFTAGKNETSGQQFNVGVILSGGQAPGGHNVIAGIFDGLKKGNSESRLFGFSGGPSGLIEGKYTEITAQIINRYRNTGGFDIIGSGRTKIETPEQFNAALETVKKLNLDAVVVIGGDDSNTNAALLAEYFLERGVKTQVIGCPKTIDGDLKNEFIEASFGFDTAVKTYSELIGNIMRDANSAKKYWHFIKLMGRTASHITLEAALQTHPNVCFISEEIAGHGTSLGELVNTICDSVCKRAANGENFGVVLVPEGLVEFVPEMKALIAEINDIVARDSAGFEAHTPEKKRAHIIKELTPAAREAFDSLPDDIAGQLLNERDPHGNVQVSLIETEKLLANMTKKRLAALKKEGVYKGKFAPLTHFFGYEGRAAAPSNFDADYCYSLGFTAFLLIASGLTGYLSSVRNLCKGAGDWIAGGIPLTMMMNLERRHGSSKPVIKKALVDLKGKPFKTFAAARAQWAEKTCFVYPGAIQYFGPSEVCDTCTITLRLEHEAVKPVS